jgi:IS30 family transposase
VLQIEVSNGASIRSIARRLSRAASELFAGQHHQLHRKGSVRRCRLVEGGALFQGISDHLIFYRWSPRQIAVKLRAMHPDDPSERVSYGTIYAANYAHLRRGSKKGLVEALRQHGPARGLHITMATKRKWVAGSFASSTDRKKWLSV